MSIVKVLHLISDVEQKKAVGGAEILLLCLLKKINKFRFEFKIAYPHDGVLSEEFRKNGAEVISFETKSKFDMGAINRLVRIIKLKKISIVHSHQTRLDFFGCIAAKFAGIPFIFTRHLSISDLSSSHWKKQSYMYIDRIVTVKYAKKIVAVSKDIAGNLIAKENADSYKTKVIYAGIDLENYRKGISIGEVRKEFGLGSEIPLVGVIARLNEQKAHQYFLSAAVEVLKAVPLTKFLIVGDGPLKEKHGALCRELGLEEQVIFAGYRKDTARILADLDVAALSSLSEGVPVTIVEAMAMSKPMVCFNVGGVPELVVDGVTGILVPIKDVKALADGIVRLLKNKEEAKQMGEAGRRRVEEYFNLERMVKEYEKVYNEV
ncbi:MAG: glycosyltransferase [Candidatus Omnitrophica bacterium]|nr:glycosyltransferase [Candidatus Omnitrophota bacterium]MBU4478284.1 glycosyltransferase [Candidatus Omnitrophota bacterium]MCG2703352.1 glycosyltransferase [Candidatus Omnitrophota bacterium]